jgi:hypothetical protein
MAEQNVRHKRRRRRQRRRSEEEEIRERDYHQ